MKTALKKALKSYQEECQNMADIFVEWYYCDDDITPADVELFWVADQIGGVLCINDDFWGMNELIDIFNLQPTEEQLFAWKHSDDEAISNGDIKINLRSYLMLNQKEE